MNPSDFIHPEDAKALGVLKSIPLFPKLMQKLMEYGYEEISWCENVATNLRLSENQMPEIYRHLVKICGILGIPVPEMYLSLDPYANAWTSGYKRVYIVVTLGLVKRFKEEELDLVLAHECGHIICGHTLYQMVANALMPGTEVVTQSVINQIPGLSGLGSVATIPLRQAMSAWERASELSADRVAVMCSSADAVAKVMAKLDGFPQFIVDTLNLDAFSEQGRDFQAMRNSSFRKKAIRFFTNYNLDHPFSTVRAFEAKQWEESEHGQNVCRYIKAIATGNVCPVCKAPIGENWSFCKNCGCNLTEQQ